MNEPAAYQRLAQALEQPEQNRDFRRCLELVQRLRGAMRRLGPPPPYRVGSEDLVPDDLWPEYAERFLHETGNSKGNATYSFSFEGEDVPFALVAPFLREAWQTHGPWQRGSKPRYVRQGAHESLRQALSSEHPRSIDVAGAMPLLKYMLDEIDDRRE